MASISALFQQACQAPEFKQWLVTTLGPICDAEPDVLADYVIALLTDSDAAKAAWGEQEWFEYAVQDLQDFLGDQSRSFVERCFNVVKTMTQPAAEPIAAAEVPVGAPALAAPTEPRQDGEIEMAEGAVPADGAPRKQRCRDYHERGYCMRGASCQFEHSDDMIIPTPEMMVATMGGFPGPGGSGPQRGGFRGRGGPRGRGRGGPPGHMPFDPAMMGMMGMPMPGMPGMPPMPGMPFFPPAGPPSEFQLGTSRPPGDRKSTTLLITDIPPKDLNMSSIREYFGQFGDVTNVAIEGKSRRALVSFASNREAYQAWKSDEAVFGSRHVKILWHRPRPGQGDAGNKMLEQSANLIANMKKLESGESTQGDHVATLEGPESRLKKTLADLEVKERRQKKETLIAEQKVLFARAATASQEDKITILNRVKEISKEMAAIDKPEPVADVDMSEKDKLDAELAKHGMETTAGKDQEELLKLSAQLAALRDKASTMGIQSTRYSPYGRGSPRGRARGRGRGRGGYTRPMRLDNRSKTVLISGDALSNEAAQSSVKEWYESTGGTLAPAPDGGVLVTYPSREMAEKALALGTKEISNLTAPLNVAWHAANGSGTNGTSTPSYEDDHEMGEMGEEDGEIERRERD